MWLESVVRASVAGMDRRSLLKSIAALPLARFEFEPGPVPAVETLAPEPPPLLILEDLESPIFVGSCATVADLAQFRDARPGDWAIVLTEPGGIFMQGEAAWIEAFEFAVAD